MLTFTATTELTANSGTVAIPVVVDGKAFELTFSFSVALKGAAGADGEDAYYLETPFTWNTGETEATFTAVIYKGETDVTEDYHASCFEWYLRTENGESRIAVGRTCTVAKSTLGYGGTVVCIFTSHENENAALLTRSNKALLSASGSGLTMLTQSEGEIRVVDLPVKTATAVNLDDYLMGIDAADGYQVTVSDLATRMATGVFDARYVNADGDTMTGQLTVHYTNPAMVEKGTISMRIGAETLSANQRIGALFLQDNNGDVNFYSETYRTTDNITYTSFVHRRFSADGATAYYNGFYLDILNDGTRRVRFSDNTVRDAWANALNVVKKAGDTMAGNLVAQYSGFDLSKSNNGVSSTQYPTTFCILDNGGRISTRIEGIVWSSGNMGSYWYVRNYNTSGTSVGQKGIQMIMDKSGNLTYSISDVANFRSAIGAVNRAGDTMTANFALSATDATGRFWKVKNSKHEGSFYVDASGNLEIWSDSKGKWIVRSDASGNVYLNNHNLTNGIKGWTNLGSTTGTTAKAITASSYTEILVVMNRGTSYWGSCLIPVVALSTTANEWYCGGGNKGGTSGSARRGVFKATTTAITPVLVSIDGTDYSNSSVVTRIYAR